LSAARVAAIAEARSWVGTKFHHGARIRGVGVDCGQLLAAVYQPAEPGPDYLPDWWQHGDREILLDQVLAYAHEVAAPQPGDVALWKFGRCWSHAGIVTDWPTVIHALGGLVVMEEDTVSNRLFEGRPVRFFSPWGDR
jgi:cell wall-associated NlpC family hydrolase